MQPIPQSQLNRWTKHDRPDHRKMNLPVYALDAMTRGVAAPRQVMPTVRGAGAAPAVSAGTVTQQFRLNHILRNYLIARTWDSEIEGDEDINIAMPYLLRRDPWDGSSRGGISYTYVSNGLRQARTHTTSEMQVIVPAYRVRDVIYASRPIIGGVSVQFPAGLEWLDDNRDGRAWARRFEQ